MPANREELIERTIELLKNAAVELAKPSFDIRNLLKFYGELSREADELLKPCCSLLKMEYGAVNAIKNNNPQFMPEIEKIKENDKCVFIWIEEVIELLNNANWCASHNDPHGIKILIDGKITMLLNKALAKEQELKAEKEDLKKYFPNLFN